MLINLTRLFSEFLKSERAGGILLIFCAFLSLLLSNSPFQADYLWIWQFSIVGQPATHWINDGLMTIFFLLIGLELEREIYVGELSRIKNAMLPVFAALGGMIIPAAFFLFFNFGTQAQAGAGIPMATDIAFAIAIISLLGSSVPTSLKIFLTALAVIDDLGAIFVIAIFYTNSVSWITLLAALAIFAFLLLLNRLKITSLIPYLCGGMMMWYFMIHSGVHPTITGILLAFAIPFRSKTGESPSARLQHRLHKPVAFVVLPLFALANTAMVIDHNWYSGLLLSNSLGILTGLIAGKPLGIVLFSLFSVATGLCVLPGDLRWKHIVGVGFLGGIGFTMSIFITLLAFDEGTLITQSKIAVLVGSSASAVLGYLLLITTIRSRKPLVSEIKRI